MAFAAMAPAGRRSGRSSSQKSRWDRDRLRVRAMGRAHHLSRTVQAARQWQGGPGVTITAERDTIARGTVVAVRGSVVDVRFEGDPPGIHHLLQTGGGRSIRLEVVSQLDERTVRCLAFNSTNGMARGDAILDTGAPLQVPVGPELLGRVFDVFGEPIDGRCPVGAQQAWPLLRPPVPLDEQAVTSEILPTGIKAIDLLAPLERGGKAGL